MIKRLIASILALFIFSPSGEVAAYSPLDKDSMLTSFTVISDGHLEGNNSERHDNYGEGFTDMAANEVMSRALVLLGDNTMNGQALEESMLYGLMKKYNKIENVLMAAGNHELCPGEHNTGDAEKLQKRFIDFNNAFLEHKIEKVYHYQVIDGYYYIILGSEGDAGIQQYISEEQLSWLQDVLDEAEAGGNPVFLFNHNPPENAFGDVWQEGHIGEQSDKLTEILNAFDNRIFFFTGHLHMGVFENDYGISENKNITHINVPAFGAVNDNGDADVQDTGMGLQVEVYEDTVSVRIRNFVKHEWTDYRYDFKY